jgi:intraflagellar transport protein 81
MKNQIKKPQFNSTTLVQEIVNILKQPPFSENLTLMSFDEKKEYELLEIIIKVLAMIDEDLKISKNETETSVLKKILDFLKIVNFPHNNEKQLEEDLNKAEKRLLIQIIHFTLVNLNDLKKKYYLSKFLNSITVPDELTGDEEIVNLMNQYRELQSEFQATYQQAEEKRMNKPNLKDLKDEIKKLQTDKLQLNNNISNFKKNYSQKKDFQLLFESTSKLRKEQEEDSNLDKRMIKQQYELEDIDNKLILSKQKLQESKINLKDDISSIEMLGNIRNQRDKNREIYENLSNYEIVDKKSKLKALEEILLMPEITYDILNTTRQEKRRLEGEIEKLEAKEKMNSSKSSEISIYRNNAVNAANSKEQTIKTLEKLEKEKQMLDSKYQELENKYETTFEHRYVRKDDLLQQIESIKKKKDIYVKCTKNIDLINSESLLLDRTINILKANTPNFDEISKIIESKYGNTHKKDLEILTKKKIEIDQQKEITLEEYSKLIADIKKKIEGTYSLHAPLIDQQKKLKTEFEDLQPEYNKRRKNYDNEMQDTLDSYNKIKDNYIALEKEFATYQNDYHSYNIKLKILDSQIKRYESENTFQKEKRLNKDFKNFSEYYHEIMNYQSLTIKDLDYKKNIVRDNSQDNFRQIKFFNNLKKLLIVKKASLLNENN